MPCALRGGPRRRGGPIVTAERGGPAGTGLTRRQAQTLQMVSAGADSHEMAERLGISARTVQKHLQLCYWTLGVASRSEAASVAWSVVQP
jgi:DNA-binding NarL/FixJ family response regulator